MDKTKLSEWGEKLKTGGAQMSRMVSGKMKEILQGPTPESRIVDEATLDTLQEPNWGLNMKICAMINSLDFEATDIVRAIKKKISAKNNVTQSLSLDLLESCTTNCANVASEVASEGVLEEMVKMIENPHTHRGNRGRALQLIGVWGQSRDLAHLPVFHRTLCGKTPFFLLNCLSNVPNTNSIYASLSAEEKKEVFEVTRNSLEVLSSMLSKETEPKPTLDELTESMFKKCKQSQPVIQMIIESTTDDDGVLFEALNLHDELHQVISKFEELEADSKSERQLNENSGTTEANPIVPFEACNENMMGAPHSTNEEFKVIASPTFHKETMSVAEVVDAMGKKKETKNKSKDSGRVQDQNMANAFEYEIALQVQEPNEETCEEPSLVPENGKNVSKGKEANEVSREENAAIEELKEIKLWGVPLLPSKRHEGTDIVLLKFLKAKDYKVNEAFEMLSGTLKWRKEFKVDEIIEENLGDDFDNLGYLNSRDKEVQFLEKAIKELKFEAGGANSIVQILDLKHSSGQTTKELRSVSRKSWKLLQDPYSEFIHRNIIINVPLWFYISHVFSSRLKAQTENGRVVIARPGKVTSTLLKFIPPENLPVEYGGLKRENDGEFSTEDKALVVKAKANTTEHIQIPTTKAGMTMIWDLTVVGAWDVSYKEEFIPDDEGSYRVLIQNEKDKKKGGSVGNSFYISEPGKIVISIANFLLKKKKILYRYKTKPTFPVYAMIKK
ncbi:Sec14p-like phosphatidylinositol transfer family protein, putative isoform 2 [Hibiscus syriacus]|uniref:Sec14p-like phosphatidylinositol transfer family protein, putative isoform 2 n=1 Tax=Hibiscus syriacus TaxID=106335 RepID=A0A6A3CCF4_HIBSY|nr:Sec14p-like phosphatidylinositol transfer family protein, putative isoform 2 [Hibiscus syriacus]